MEHGPLVLQRVVKVLEHAQDLKLPLQKMVVLHVVAQQQRQKHATLKNVKVVKIKRYNLITLILNRVK